MIPGGISSLRSWERMQRFEELVARGQKDIRSVTHAELDAALALAKLELAILSLQHALIKLEGNHPWFRQDVVAAMETLGDVLALSDTRE